MLHIKLIINFKYHFMKISNVSFEGKVLNIKTDSVIDNTGQTIQKNYLVVNPLDSDDNIRIKINEKEVNDFEIGTSYKFITDVSYGLFNNRPYFSFTNK